MKSQLPEDKFREVVFEVIINSKVLEGFDISHEYWENFNVRDEKTHKQLGFFDIEHIDDPCVIIIATNSKEYIESSQVKMLIRSIKVKKGEKSMNLESFAKRIVTLAEIEHCEKKSEPTAVEQARFTVKRNEMVLDTVQKKKFSQINDKRYCFQCDIVSMPFDHPSLHNINQLKHGQKKRMRNGSERK